MQCLIIAGGRVDSEQLKNVYRTLENVYVITCDRGTLYALEAGISIDRAIGDFDSVSDEEFAEIKKLLEEDKAGVIEKLIPEKDDTDTEHALQYALSLSPDCIVMMGCTGTRLDQTFNSINLLVLSAERNVPAFILDRNNRVRVIKGRVTFDKKKSFGKYVSVIPLGESAHIKEISGFKYDVKDITLHTSVGRGISNELVLAEGVIDTEDYLIVFETQD